ncbi:MAG: hypothetical protein AAB492_03870 [Patescibacteria group bacterium]
MLTKRTNILFDEELWNILVAEAAKRKTSVGDLVRFAARKIYSDGGKVVIKKKKEKSILDLAGKYKAIAAHKKIDIDNIRDYIDYSDL